MAQEYPSTGKPLTGRKVFFIIAGAFAVIIAVNIAMAVAAIGTFPGIEVKNGYVASQSFEKERAAQLRLGWTAKARYDGARLHLAITDRAGAAVDLSEITLRMGRPTTEAQDLDLAPAHETGGYFANADLAPGVWRIDILAKGAAGESFRQQLMLEVRS